MLFTSTIFLFLFLPILITIYYLIKDEYKNYTLLFASLFFYAWGGPKYVIVMILSIAVNYAFGMLLDKRREYGKLIVSLAVLFNLGMLGYFKYTNFFIQNINNLFGVEYALKSIVMPIGISFFTFQAMSYVIDVYRKEVAVQKNIYKLALYVSFFPQLIAGPIVKYHDVCEQIENRTTTTNDILDGCYRFIIGFAKKIILANSMGFVADNIYNLDLVYISPAMAWIGSIAYMLQLFFDFSAYSDMAIGLGKMFGFTFLENFNYPYISKSISEFWRRWHISLGTWFRQYLYIPLGGNRKGVTRTYINLFIVFFVTGFWHGASWSFIIWGLWHGVFQIIERITGFTKSEKVPNIIKHVYVLLVVNIGWVFFRADDLDFAIDYLKKMFLLDTNYTALFDPRYYLSNNVIILMIIGVLVSTPIFKNLLNYQNTNSRKVQTIQLFFVTLLFIISIALLSATTYNPFIYFRF